MLEAGAVFASASDCIKIWDARSDHLNLNSHYTTENLSGSSSFKDVSWNLSNSGLACIASGSGIILYNFQEGVKDEGIELQKSREQTAVCFGNGRNVLFSGGATGDINQWNCTTHELTKSFLSTHGSAVRRLVKMNDRIVSASASGDLFIWHTEAGSVLTKLKTPKTKSIRGLEHSRYDRTMLSTTSDDGIVCLWDVEKQVVRHKFSSHNAPAMDLSFSTINALLLASGGLDKKIIFYDAQAKNIVQTFTSTQPVTAVCFLGNGMHVCAGTSVGNILLYDLRNNTAPLSSLHGHSTSVQRLTLQTLKERKKSSRTSSSKPLEKKLSRTREENPTESSVPRPNDQQPLAKASRNSSNRKSAVKPLGTESTAENVKVDVDKNLVSPMKSASNDKSTPRFMPSNRSNTSTHHDTMGSYCEGIFSPIAGANGSIQEELLLNENETKPFSAHRSSGIIPHSGLTDPITPIATAEKGTLNGIVADASLSNGTVGGLGTNLGNPNSIHGTALANSTPSSNSESVGRRHRLSTPVDEGSFNTQRQGRLGAGAQTANASNPFQYQLDFLQNSVRDLIEEHEDNMRDELKHLHLQMIKMFAEQNEVIAHLAEQCSVNPLLLQEIERLRSENDRLRKNF